jgi:GNAT superfamily N-acetyltransferase
VTPTRASIEIRQTGPEDFAGISELSRTVYPDTPPWNATQLASHRGMFPEGQFVAVDHDTGRIVGMAATLIGLWDDYERGDTWRDFTDVGMFTNHDPEHGHTLYGAEVMVAPDVQGCGIGSQIYEARGALVRRRRLWRIRAGARLRGYHHHADRLSPQQYVDRVVAGEIRDPTLSFQLHRGFRVLAIVPNYLRQDDESLGHAAVIEWLNPEIPPDQMRT